MSVYSKTNELIAYNAKNVRIPVEIKGVTLSEEDRAKLLAGEVIYIEGLTDQKGEQHNAYIKVNNEMGKLNPHKTIPLLTSQNRV